jgi:hypothetical protein
VNNVVRSLLAEMADDQEPRPAQDLPGTASKPKHEGYRQIPATPALALSSGERPVLCVSGPGRFDHTIALVLAEMLARAGLPARLETAAAISALNVARLDTADVKVVCLSYLQLGQSPAHLRYSIRRLRRRIPSATIVACLWGYEEIDVPKAELTAAGVDRCALTLAEAVDLCVDAVLVGKDGAASDQSVAARVDAA